MTDGGKEQTMSRWIDGEWLLNFFEPYPNDYHTPLGTLRACVDDAPNIDIVRCDECKWVDKCSQNVAMQDTYQMYEKIDYCSYGERSTND